MGEMTLSKNRTLIQTKYLSSFNPLNLRGQSSLSLFHWNPKKYFLMFSGQLMFSSSSSFHMQYPT